MSSFLGAAEKYFQVWNAHDVAGLRALLADNATLRDWDIEKSGGDDVAAANGGIFEAVPNISIEVVKMHEAGCVICCEILVHLNDEAKTVLKVVDVIEFTDDAKIAAVRAYKG
mmetsp:Transcript_131355/g.262103  ORF Transcript_131355/g.262103 Transcript_131355/m.262103 type:complete len:113 (-) Transcript_131355:75-413(-)|eukprot:CAMPEP_0172660852 /NCGR_PEP_ID=MMETSP1074-20121228/4299_1 /TAXON_ID=2916 /ORGANISM="Ceratium fusus, Strain PA161109" /LENGTH=112 /DNA_ID=CAMNT_0013476507 /DNA_START=45 /DNA_END=383 /DNA_ORIENTATION=+